MVSIVLEDGYMTKGNGQNLTAFYFEADNQQELSKPNTIGWKIGSVFGIIRYV